MKKLLLLVYVFVLPLFSEGTGDISAQEKIRPLTKQEISEFDKSLKEKSKTTISLESAFVQEKRLEMLSRKMVSEGTFCFRREDKIAFMYEKPVKYYMIINGTRLGIENNGKNQIVDLKSNPLMKEMKALIEASFLGRLSDIGASYAISYFQKGGSIVVEVVPANKSVSEMIKKITVTFDMKTFDVVRLHLDEGTKSSTSYQFTGQKYNTLKDDEKFIIH